MTRLLLPLVEIPPCVRESLRVCLKAHDIELPEEVLVECGNNVAQGLFSIDVADHGEPDDDEVDSLDVFHRATTGGAIGREKHR